MGRSGYRVGQGVDVHRFDASRAMRLCGVELDGIGPGLSGHSDADVALHAVTDALLGAVGAGDIGEHFPPTDPRWRDADSREFVRFAMERVAEEGYRVSSCDLTVIGERPKIAPHRAQLRAGLASSLGVAGRSRQRQGDHQRGARFRWPLRGACGDGCCSGGAR